MYITANTKTAIFLAALGVATTTAFALLPNSAHAWEFESCSSTLVNEVDLRAPQAMIMLDRSGSMTTRIEHPPMSSGQYWNSVRMHGAIWPNNPRTYHTSHTGANWADPSPYAIQDPALYPPGKALWSADFSNQSPMIEPSYGYHEDGRYARTFWFHRPGSLWDITVRELGTVLSTYDTPNGARIKFGLGTFTNWYTSDVVTTSDGWGMIWKEASEYTNAADYMEFFDHPQQGGPSIGATPTQRAIDVMRASSTIANQNTSNAGILITDGVPNLYEVNGTAYSGNAAYAATVDAACRHREAAPLYVIGFSGGSDQQFNNIVAAAGGTGQCRHQNNNVVDPCNSGYTSQELMQQLRNNTLTCSGAYQADSGTQLQEALDTITNQIACTYPLDILNTPNGQAPEDPEGTRVHLGQCTPGPGTHTAWGSEFDAGRSTGSHHATSRTALGFACTGQCGSVNTTNHSLTYDMPTTPGQTNTVRLRVADYLHNCSDTLKVEVRVDSNTVLGTWTGSGINDWAVIEFDFIPTHDKTFITIIQKNDAWCNSSNSCDSSCTPLAGDLNLYVDWVKVVDPEANCAPTGGQPYVAPGTSGDGWTFAENRTKVKLVGQACADVQNRQYSKVVTQVACPCEQIPGGMCKTGAGASCPVGLWECSDQWEDICVPDPECNIGECAPVTQHDLTRRQPNVQMVVDNSGSMGWRIQDSRSGNQTAGHPDEARHWIAKRVLADVVNDSYQGPGCQNDGTNCDKLRLGIHFWSTSKKLRKNVQEDMTKRIIESAFDNNRPTGGTNFHLAAEILRDEAGLTDANAANVGIMVTDGAPGGFDTFKKDMEITCNIRKRAAAPIATYVLGFGTGNAEKKNSAIAAAGGTGICCYGSTCNADDPNATNHFDPCAQQGKSGSSSLDSLSKAIYYNDSTSFSGGRVTCDGNIEATDAAMLKQKLQNLFSELECVFPLTLLPDMEAASSNPIGTKVNIFLKNAGDLVKVPHIDDGPGRQQFVAQLRAKGIANPDDFADDGWSFANAGRTAVRLSRDVCDQIQGQEITRVDTQVCEVCENQGAACPVPCRPGVDDNCGSDGYLNGRCRMGEFICVAGDEVCVQTRNPMPEICNGIDDSCDGVVDNLSDNATDWSDPKWSMRDKYSGKYAALACYGQDLCGCENGQPDEMNGLASDPDEFKSHLAGQYTAQNSEAANCYCGTGLTPSFSDSAAAANEQTSSPSAPHTDDGAACSISGTSDSSPLDAWWLFGVFGLFGASRAKRRYLN